MAFGVPGSEAMRVRSELCPLLITFPARTNTEPCFVSNLEFSASAAASNRKRSWRPIVRWFGSRGFLRGRADAAVSTAAEDAPGRAREGVWWRATFGKRSRRCACGVFVWTAARPRKKIDCMMSAIP